VTAVALRLERVACADLDRHLVMLGAIRLVRAGYDLTVDVAPEAMSRAVAILARAGMRVCSEVRPDVATRGLVPGIASDLEPFVGSGIVDIVRMRALDEGEATARIARRSLLNRRVDVDAIRTILRGSDRAFVWTRTVYAPPRTIRGLRGVRPVVFDRAALERADERLAFVGQGVLTRWVS
jgi:hypothetical protein